MTDLTPKVIEATDTTIFERATGKTRRVTRVLYLLGELGPFRADFDEGTFTESALRSAMDDKAAALRLHT